MIELDKKNGQSAYLISNPVAQPSLRAWITLAKFGLLYMLSFRDRFILALLVGPLKAELHLSDVQIGLLFGSFFAFCYALFLLAAGDARGSMASQNVKVSRFFHCFIWREHFF